MYSSEITHAIHKPFQNNVHIMTLLSPVRIVTKQTFEKHTNSNILTRKIMKEL